MVMDVERLGDHTNADDQSVYRDAEEIRLAQAGGRSDPGPCVGAKARSVFHLRNATKSRREVRSARARGCRSVLERAPNREPRSTPRSRSPPSCIPSGASIAAPRPAASSP